MSPEDPAPRQGSRVELDQRSRTARLQIEHLERAFAGPAAPPSANRDRRPDPVGTNIRPLPLRRLRSS
jgi:hypothetical protein